MDVLSDAVTAMRTGVPHSSLTTHSAPWGMRFAGSTGAGFHMILQGSCWLSTENLDPMPLSPGEVVLLPHGRGHAIADNPDSPLTEIVQSATGRWIPTEDSSPGKGSVTSMLCGSYSMDRTREHPLMTGLPEVVHLPARIGTHASLRAAVELIGRELTDPGPGSDVLVPTLLDTLLVYIVRAWLDDHSEEATVGWASALADPMVSLALHAIHSEPDRGWTVEELGRRAGASRATLARRFTTLVGTPPLAYLTWWRMTIACRLLTTDDSPIRVVAARVGYSSEFSFAKAFKSRIGTTPASYRRRHSS